MNERTKKNRQRNEDNTMANTKMKCNFGQTGKKIVPYFCILTLSMGFALGILFLWVEKGRERIFVVKAFEL